MTEVRLPQLGMGMTDGTIIRWCRAVGDVVAKGEILCEIEAAKATAEVEAPVGGTIAALLVAIDENVPVNTPIAIIAEDGVAIVSSAPVPEPAPQPQGRVAGPSLSVQIEPRARRAAREFGVALDELTGSGPGGRIVEADVLAAMRQKELPEILASGPSSAIRPVAILQLKRSCDVGALLALRERLAAGQGTETPSFDDLVVRAVVLALAEVPEANASWRPDGPFRHDRIDLAIATPAGDAFTSPVLRDAGRKPLSALAAGVRDLAARARDGKLRPEEMRGAAILVSNLAIFEVEEFTAALEPAQSCAFAIGAVAHRPVVRNGALAVAKMMTVTLSVDPRVIGGPLAARLLAAFAGLIAQPEMLAR